MTTQIVDVRVTNGVLNEFYLSLEEVSRHDSFDDCWIILYDRVYDVTNFLNSHPGGFEVLIEYAGRDATVAFRGHSVDAIKSLTQYQIGELPPHERIYRCKNGIVYKGEFPE